MSDKHHLPVVGTTAASTDFVSVKLEHADGSHIWLDGNQKISGWAPVPNALSLRAQAVTDRRWIADSAAVGSQLEGKLLSADCPGSTAACRASCYVGPLEKHQRAIYDLYDHNSDAIRAILTTGGGYAIDWADRLGEWITQNCADVGFRFHVSGDVFSAKHARWIVEVCSAAPTVGFWIYTRSFDFVADLLPAATARGGNLALNLSADRDNIAEARALASRYDLRVCYLIASPNEQLPVLAEGDVTFPDYPLRPKGLSDPMQHPWWQSLTPAQRRSVCPVDAFGKAQNVRCGVCTKCLT